MGSVYRERVDDSRTSVSARNRDGGSYTVKRYIIKDDDSRSVVSRRGPERVEETRVTRLDDRHDNRELVVRRDEPAETREIVVRRSEDLRYDDRPEARFRDEYEVVSPRGFVDERDLQRYTRTANYYERQPQTIIIRQEPVVIRERIRDDDYQIVRRSDLDDEKSVARRDRSRSRDEELVYEKKVKERYDDRRSERGHRDDDYDDRRQLARREVSPGDSVSQVGRRRGRRGSYESDDSMVYVRKETVERSRSPSPDRRKSIAAGVIAGVGAAELVRNHHAKQGKQTSHGLGRIGRDLGAGIAGAVVAEGLNRARNHSRSRSRSRSRSVASRRSRKRRDSSSSGSDSGHHKLKTLGIVGLGAAALAAAAGVAQKRMDKKNEGSPNRGRSPQKDLMNDPTAEDARNPKHRNIRAAEAGAAGAAIAALVEHARNKNNPRSRSQSKVRKALPVVVAGLGSAALAGMYEKNKARTEADRIRVAEDRRTRSRSRSRGRSNSVYEGPPQASMSAPGMIDYGHGPVYGNNYGSEYHGPPTQQPPADYYTNQQNAVVPVVPAAAGAGYGAQRDMQSPAPHSQSRERTRRSPSLSSSDGERRRRSEQDARTAAAAPPGVGAGTEYERRKERKERRARKRAEQDRRYSSEGYADDYHPPLPQPQPYAPTPPPVHDPYAAQSGFYPQSNPYAPQNTMPQPAPVHANAPPGSNPGYGPQSFGGSAAPPPSGPSTHFDPYAPGVNPYAQPRRTDENVSQETSPHFANPFADHVAGNQNPPVPEGVNTTRGVSPPAIQVHPPSLSEPEDQPHPGYSDKKGPPLDNRANPLQNHQRAARDMSPASVQSQEADGPMGSSERRKSVHFQATPLGPTGTAAVAAVAAAAAASTNHDQIPEADEQHRYRNRPARGYEAGDDTDTPADDRRRRASHEQYTFNTHSSQRDRNRDRDRNRHRDQAINYDQQGESSNRRRRRHRRSSDSATTPPSTYYPGPSNSRQDGERERSPSPAPSDETIEMPARFDNHGRRLPEQSDNPLADKIQELLSGGKSDGGQGENVFGSLIESFLGGNSSKRR